MTRLDAVGAWPVPWAPSGCRGVWPVPSAPSGRRGGVAGSQHPVWPQWGCGRSLGSRVAPVGVWPVPCASGGICWGVYVLLGPVWPRGGVAGALGLLWASWERDRPIWMPWDHGQFPGTRLLAVGRGRSPVLRVATVMAWPVDWARVSTVRAWPVPCTPSGCHGGMAGPLGPVWPPWVRGRSPGPRVAAMGCIWSRGPRLAAMGAWPVCRAPDGRRWCVAGLLAPGWPPW